MEDRRIDDRRHYERRIDDEIYCLICKEALKYDKENKEWRTKYIREEETITRRCFDGRIYKWDHRPIGNQGRLIRAIKRRNDKIAMGLIKEHRHGA